MRQMHAVRLLVATGLVAAVVPSGVRSVSAAPTITKGVYKLVDVGTIGNHYDRAKIDLRIERNEAFDSLVDATKITGAATDMDSGGEHDASSGCALVSGDLWCWGSNKFGRFGDGTTDPSPTPKLIMAGVKDYYSSTLHTCAVKNNGDLVCAGGSTSYLSGFLTTFSAPIATDVVAINDAGWPCITKSNGRLLCAGNFRRSAGHSDRFVPAEWTWEDTGLLGSGEISVSVIMDSVQSNNWWDQKRVVCAIFGGRVSCTVMDPHTRGSSIPTFATPVTLEGASNVTDLYVVGRGFGDSSGTLYVHSDGLLFKASRFESAGPPTMLEPVGSMERPSGMVPTPWGVGSTGDPAFLFEAGLGTLAFDPVGKFTASTLGTSNTIVRVTARSSLFQVIPMEVSTDVRGSRSNARLRVTAGGRPVVGATVSWRAADLPASIAPVVQVPSTTDIDGWIDLPTVSTGPVTFEVSGGINESAYLTKARSTVTIGSTGDVAIALATPPTTSDYSVTVTSRDGQPVPSAVVKMTNLFRTNQTTAASNGAAAWSTSKPVEGYLWDPACPQCFAEPVTLITGEDGKVTFSLYSTNWRWPIYRQVTDGRVLEMRGWGDFIASYNDGVANVDVTGVLNGASTTVRLPLDGGVSLAGAREVSAPTGAGASIAVRGATDGIVTEEICDVLVTGGLWSESKRFDQRSCSNGAMRKASVGAAPMAGLKCAKSAARRSGSRISVCPKRSMYVRMRIPGKAGTKGVCVMVAKKPCTTRQSVRHGVPKVLQSGRSATLSSLAATTRKTKLSATVRTSSRSRCAIKSGRLVAKKTTGDCAVSITARTGNRVVVYDLSVLVVR